MDVTPVKNDSKKVTILMVAVALIGGIAFGSWLVGEGQTEPERETVTETVEVTPPVCELALTKAEQVVDELTKVAVGWTELPQRAFAAGLAQDSREADRIIDKMKRLNRRVNSMTSAEEYRALADECLAS